MFLVACSGSSDVCQDEVEGTATPITDYVARDHGCFFEDPAPDQRCLDLCTQEVACSAAAPSPNPVTFQGSNNPASGVVAWECRYEDLSLGQLLLFDGEPAYGLQIFTSGSAIPGCPGETFCVWSAGAEFEPN